ncbi:MAG: hypothetical protein SGJ10_10915 [Bacteroidota bacterium]|nr:hypothetical protein [Bacteroidota bacterium]
MPFGENFDLILPKYLVNHDKARLQDALKKFIPDGGNKRGEIDYTNFYKNSSQTVFLQSDLIKEIRYANWNNENSIYEKEYINAIIISNSCDISFQNEHSYNIKQCLFAPLIDFNEYLNTLKAKGHDAEKISAASQTIKSQLVSNILYLPNNENDNKEYIVLFDNIFWFPTIELNSYIEQMEENKISSLGLFGYYLFILKLSYHLCRLPDEYDNR